MVMASRMNATDHRGHSSDLRARTRPERRIGLCSDPLNHADAQRTIVVDGRESPKSLARTQRL
jgi:hypothetical protein